MFEVRTGSTAAVVDITDQAASFVQGRGDGLLHVFVPHATAGVAIIETGSGSEEDLLRAVDDLLPADGRWRRNEVRVNACRRFANINGRLECE